MLERLKTISCAALAMIALGSLAPWAAQAQEVQKKWESYLSMGQPRATEAAVQKDIRSLFSQYEKDKPFDWHVKRQRVLGKKVIYDYRVRPEKIVTTDWVYIHSGQEYSSEDQIRSVILATRVSDPRAVGRILAQGRQPMLRRAQGRCQRNLGASIDTLKWRAVGGHRLAAPFKVQIIL
ncbi:hypothetical protein ABW41_09665 [Stenotrophomonas maltophilia]|nr:hypothetical protein ABW41_09665 [Stenotrophomonas maltophilia]